MHLKDPLLSFAASPSISAPSCWNRAASGPSAPAKAKEDSDNKSVKPKMRIKDMAKNSYFVQIKPILGG